MTKALVTKIVKDSILDGPGIRYVVFVKGCHLACPWCHNPETQSRKQEILRYPQFCIQCGKCIENGPKGTPRDIMPVKVDNKNLEQYLSCVADCPSNALEFSAKEYSVDELIKDMKKYRTVYLGSKGGMTISGGEPLLQKNFSMKLFQEAKTLGFHTAIDSTVTLNWSVIENFLHVVDLWLIDIKHPNDKALKSDIAITNLLKLSKQKDVRIWVRIPIVPNFNDNPVIWEQIATVISRAGDAVQYVDLLPFHPYGAAKYEALGKPYVYEGFNPLDSAVITDAKSFFDQYFSSEKVRMGREMVNS